MKQEIIKTKKPLKILQVYHNFYLYLKDKKSYSDRRSVTAWREKIHSKSGYLQDGQLVMAAVDVPSDVEKSDLIILHDFNTDSETETINRYFGKWSKELIEIRKGANGRVTRNLTQVQFTNISVGERKFEIFSLKRNMDKIDLHLRYDKFEIGEPKRANFKLCELELGVPVQIKINGKLDHSMSSGRERSFKEHDYILHFLGETDELVLCREPFEGIEKPIPKPAKVIDLMKPLY